MKDYVSEISSYLPDTISSDTDYSKVAYGKAYRTETLDDSMVDSDAVDLEKKRQEKLQQAQNKKLSLTSEDLTRFNSQRLSNPQEGYVEVNKNALRPESLIIPGVGSGYYPKELVDQYMAPSNSTDNSQTDDLSNKLAEARLEDRGFVGDAVATVKGLAANVGRGAVNLGQSAGELVTLPFQETYNAVTGKNDDWNIYSDDTAKKISKGIDKVVGYDREVDELAAKRVEDSFKKAGVDILDPSTYKNAANIEGFGKQLLDVIPAAVSGFGDLIGGGVALGAGSKLVIKGLEKAIPSVGSKVDEFTTLNKTRAIEEVKDLKAKAAAGTIDNIKYKDGMLAIEIDYNLGKKIPDLIKGNSMSNAYFLTQMDENLEKFKENNGGVSATPEEMLRIATITKFMAELQASAAGKVLGVGELDTAVKAASQSAIKSVLDPVASTLGKGTYEAIQEGLDQAAIEVNQKYGTKAYEGKSVTDIISDSSAEIITGMVLGGVGGGTVTGGREAVSSIKGTGISEALGLAVDKIGKGVQGSQEQKPYAFDNFTDEAEKQKARDYISVLGSLENTDKSNPSPYTTPETIYDTVDKLYEIKANREAVVKLPPEYLAKVDMTYEGIIDDIQKAIEANPEIKLSKPVPVDQNAMGTDRTARIIDSSEESQRAAKVVELLVDGRSVSEEFLGKLRTTAAYNGIDGDTFEELVGKYKIVEDEATIEYRGYESYVAKGDVDSMQSMLGSTIASKSKLLAGIESANRKVEELNKSQPDGGKQVLVYSDYNKLDGNKFDIPVKFDGEKWVADTAQASRLIRQKDRTINGINAGLKALGIDIGNTEVKTPTQEEVTPNGTGVQGFTVTPTAAPDKVKAVKKAEASNKYIGFGVEGSSTANYAKEASKQGIEVNSGNYSPEDVVFASVNGKGRITRENLTKTFEEVVKALDAGAKVLTDFSPTAYNVGEKHLAAALTKAGYTLTDLGDNVGQWTKPSEKSESSSSKAGVDYDKVYNVTIGGKSVAFKVVPRGDGPLARNTKNGIVIQEGITANDVIEYLGKVDEGTADTLAVKKAVGEEFKSRYGKTFEEVVKDLDDQTLRKVLIAHESVHDEQIARFSSRDEFKAAYKADKVKYELEAYEKSLDYLGLLPNNNSTQYLDSNTDKVVFENTSELSEEDQATAAKRIKDNLAYLYDAMFGEGEAETRDWTSLAQEVISYDAKTANHSSNSTEDVTNKEVQDLSGLTEEELVNAAKGEEDNLAALYDAMFGESQAETLDWTTLHQEIVGKEAQNSSYDGIIDSMDERLQKEVKQAIIKATGLSKDKSIKDLLDKVIEDCK